MDKENLEACNSVRDIACCLELVLPGGPKKSLHTRNPNPMPEGS